MFVDRFIKAAHLAPCRKTCTADTVVMLLFKTFTVCMGSSWRLCPFGILAS